MSAPSALPIAGRSEASPASEQQASQSGEKDPTTLMTLPAEIRNEIYSLVLRHEENASFIAPLPLDWSSNKEACNGRRTIVNGKEETIAMDRKYDVEDFQMHYGPYIITGDKKGSGRTCDSKTRPFTHHVCTTECLLQPPRSRVSRQVREETLPVFYGINNFHFETVPFYQNENRWDARLGPRHAPVLPGNPRAWWRSIGDSNLRLIKYLRIIDRDSSSMSTPSVDVIIDRRGGKKDVCVLETGSMIDDVGKVESKVRDVAFANPEMRECTEQIEADGPFVRGIEKAMVGKQVLGIREVDWPSMEGRRRGLHLVSNTKAFGEMWIYFPEPPSGMRSSGHGDWFDEID